MGRLYIPVIILHISIVGKKTCYCNDHTITEFGIIDSKNSSAAYVILYELIDTWFLDSNRRGGGGSLIAPIALAHPLHPIDNRSRNRRRNLWVGWCVSSWWHLFPSRSAVLIDWLIEHLYFVISDKYIVKGKQHAKTARSKYRCKKTLKQKWQQLKISAYISYYLGYDTNNCDKHYWIMMIKFWVWCKSRERKLDNKREIQHKAFGHAIWYYKINSSKWS